MDPVAPGPPPAIALLLLVGLVAGPARADSWDSAAARALAADAARQPFTRLVLGPGERLRYRMETRVFPPRIPLLSSGRTVVLVSQPTFAALGFDGTAYRIGMTVESTGSDRTMPIAPRAEAAFGLDLRGRRTAPVEADAPPEIGNPGQLFRDLTGRGAGETEWVEPRTFHFHPSGFGVTRLETECRYRVLGIDPATGDLRTAMTISETAEERRRRRGFDATGTMVLDPQGRLVSIEAEGRLWKKVLFLTVSVPSTYRVERLAAP